MLLLAIDTSGKQGSIALARGAGKSADGEEFSIIETVPLSGGTFSAQLIPEISTLLARHNFAKHDIDAFAVASGPGSFTGLRVGLAAVKALAEILGKPIAAVSLLEVCAFASGLQGKVMTALDAGRGDVYVGKYSDVAASSLHPQELILSRDEFLSQTKGWHLVTPDTALADAAVSAGSSSTNLAPITAAEVARLGWRKIQAGNTVEPHNLEANYIRRTDAEMLQRMES
jgi:tRNA threonylcarbamoyladenosine biosynthesis protein TsaB